MAGFQRRRTLLDTSALIGAAALSIAAASNAAAQGRNYDIPAESLSQALRDYGRASGRQIIFTEDLVRGRKAPALKGSYDSDAALGALLDGSGLASETNPSGAIMIVRSYRPQSEGAQAAAEPTVDEIIVTASKRAERAHDVPASVSAVTGQTLAAEGAVRLEDYVAKIPGLVLSNASFANGSNQISIRGVTTGLGGNPTVGIYIDNSPFGGSNSFAASVTPDLDPQDLSRVEVLKGPQGTLYGAGSLGGLLKYVTATPDYTRFFGRVEADGWQVDGGGSGYGLRGAVNIPINSSMALRVSAYDREDPGFIDDALSGQRNVNDGRFDGGRVAFAARLNDDWTVRLTALVQHQYSKGTAVVDYDPFSMKPLYGQLEQVRAPGTGPMEQLIGAYDVQVEGDLGWATLTSSSSYDKQTLNFNLDFTSFLGPVIDGLFGVPNAGASVLTNAGLDKFSQEIRLNSPSSGRLSWQVGGFYTHENTASLQSDPTFNALDGSPLSPPLPSFLVAQINASFEEFAGFGDLTYRFSSRFDITGGLRYSHNVQHQTEVSSGLLAGGDSTLIGSSSDSAVTYLVTPRFHLNDDTMIYGRIASGYRPGGPNLAVAGVPTTFEPDSLVNYELGAKSDLFDKRLSLDIAVYYIDWKNIQVQEVSPAGLGYLGNAGAAKSKGAELSASWRPLPGLEIDGNLSHTIATLSTDLPSGAGADGSSGDELPLTPKWSGQLGADYDFAFGGQWRGLVGASYRHVGQSLGNFPSPDIPRFVLQPYDVVDLRAGVQNDRWSVTFYAKNVGDSHGQSADDNYISVTRISVIQPRTFGVAVAASF